MNGLLESLSLSEIMPDEKAWLDERLSELSCREQIILNGLLVYAPPKSGMDMINLIQNIHDCDVCFHAGDKESLGAFVAREIECISPKYMPFVDLGKIADMYMNQHPGEFADGSYIEISEDGLWPYYDGTNLAGQKDNGWSVKLKLSAAGRPDGVWLRLPDYQEINDGKPDEIQIALTALGANTVGECIVSESKCILPRVGDIALQYASVADLIYDAEILGFFLDERGQGVPGFLERYAAALEYEDCGSLKEALDIAENLHLYHRVPVGRLREYAEKELEKEGVKLQPVTAEAFNYKRYAEYKLDTQSYYLCEDGSAYIGKAGSSHEMGMNQVMEL